MAYNYSDRISSLKEQTDDQKQGRLRLRSVLWRTFLALFVLAIILSQFYSSSISQRLAERGIKDVTWEDRINQQFDDRLEFLRSAWLLSPGGASIYEGIGKSVVSALRPNRDRKYEAADILDFGSLFTLASRFFTSLILRTSFIFIAFWPLWILGFVAGYYSLRKRFAGKRTDDILGVCDRGLGPYYSGIHGPLRSNGSFSATDHSCPNLACPKMVKPQAALTHPLTEILKKHGALNQTNLDLARVILQYPDFPSIVEGEQASEEEADQEEGADKVSSLPFSTVSNAGGTILSSSLEGLASVLSAHEVLNQYVAQANQSKLSNAQLNASYASHIQMLQQLTERLSPTGKSLVRALTPNRAWALGHIPSSIVASAYLATEAGKCLVYQRQGNSFSRISRYPHLQARAVIQSLVSYGREYNGDTRLVIRQAIICSRRHGDFGRAFLPDRMPVESRALRDWLEILYTEQKKREAVSSLVELDAHLEELSVNWRTVYSRRLRQGLDVHQAPPRSENAESYPPHFWKGLVHKSVVLVPLGEVVSMALRGVDDSRVKRIAELLNVTRKFQTSISISARLPGFKRQAVEAQHTVTGDSLMDKWVIVRRMLTRYNWLSTRVGDDAVPADGYVHSVVLHQSLETQASEIVGLTMLVPIRQRRYEEMFGKQWEGIHFVDSPHPANIRIFIDKDEYQAALKRERENLRRHGSLGGKMPTAASG